MGSSLAGPSGVGLGLRALRWFGVRGPGHSRVPRDVWDECRAGRERKVRTLTYEDSSVLLLEPALEKESDQYLNAHRPGGGNSATTSTRDYF